MVRSPGLRTAQQLFAAFLRDRIAPALRERGFVGSGRTFSLHDDAHFAQVGFQSSLHNDAREVAFTINLQVVAHAAWEEVRGKLPYLPAKPAANTRYGKFVWTARAGMLMPDPHDRWWTLRADTNPDRLAGEILEAFDSWLIPELLARIGRAAEAR